MANEENGFDWEGYYNKGEDLYQQFASNAPVFDPRFEDVPMFDKEGDYSQTYIDAAGLKGAALSTGTNPRKVHFDSLFTQLQSGMSPQEKGTSDILMSEYGSEPRYNKSEGGAFQMKSPFLIERIYRDKTRNMDDFDLMDFDETFSGWIGSMTTDTTGGIEGKIIDQFKKEDTAPWGTTDTTYEAGK